MQLPTIEVFEAQYKCHSAQLSVVLQSPIFVSIVETAVLLGTDTQVIDSTTAYSLCNLIALVQYC